MSVNKYQNFKVAIYTRAYEVDMMRDLDYLKSNFEIMRRHMHVDKVYLETHRDLLVPPRDVIVPARDYLRSLGVEVAGGITITVNERNRFQTYCYTNPEDRQRLKEICAYTASLFDEFILDDFFFTSCKCKSCIEAKGERSWTDFRLELMNQAAQELVLEPARAANPKVQVVIKYPNWYEHFQGLGFDLEAGPRLFDGIHTGTETRDPVMGNQHLQPYHGYLIVRYFENIKPGGNRGGWVDPFASRYLDRYAEQLWLTLFAKAPEQTLFDFRSIQRPIQEADRAPWQGQGGSFDFDAGDRTIAFSGRHATAVRHDRPGCRGGFRAGGPGSRRTGHAYRIENLQALPFHRRGFPARLPGHARNPTRPGSAVPVRGADRAPDPVRQLRSRDRAQDQAPAPGRQERGDHLRLAGGAAGGRAHSRHR